MPEDPFAVRSPALLAAFRWYLHWFFWWRFSAVRLSRSGVPHPHEGRPLVIFTNHPSWWDPAFFMLVSPKLFPGRLGFGPMEAQSLTRYALFRKFGVFGVEPGPRGAGRFIRVARQGLADPRAILCVTAEGEFRDPRRRPVHLRPGIAHLPRYAPDAIFIPAALEYPFWNESRPEALIRFGRPVPVTGRSVPETLASLENALAETMDSLAEESSTRDPALFMTLLEGTAGAGTLYDTWRRTRALSRGRLFDPRHEPRRP